MMEISASNQLRGTVKKVVLGRICAQVQLELPGGEVITSVITSAAAERMGLAEGKPVVALIKATSVIVALP